MNLKDIMLSEIKQSQKDKYCIIPLCMRYLKSSNSQTQRTELGLLRGRGHGGGRDGEFRISGCEVAHTEWIINKVSELYTISCNKPQ